MSKAVFRMVHDEARRRAATACYESPDGYTVTVAPPKRTLQENAMLHAMLTEIAAQMPWAGMKRDVDTWKRLMVAAWCRATDEPVEFLPAIDGKGVDIVFKKTSELTKSECADLISFVQAWCAEHDVELNMEHA